MTEDKKIRIVTDASQINVLKQASTSLLRELIQLQDKFGEGLDSDLSKIREEITLLTERNSLLNYTPNSVQSQQISVPYGNGGNSIEEVLRDILNEIKDKRDSDKNESQRSASDRRGIGLNTAMSAAQGIASGNVGTMASSVISAGGSAVGGIAGMIPIIGNGLSQVISSVSAVAAGIIGNALNKAVGFEGSSSIYAQTAGGGIGNAMGVAGRNAGLYASFGMDMQQGIEYQSQFVRPSRGQDRDIEMLMRWNKQGGVDMGSINNLQRNLSFGGSGGRSADVIGDLSVTLMAIGKSSKEIQTTLSEYVDLYSNVSSKMLEKQGDIDSQYLSSLIGGIMTAVPQAQGPQLNRIVSGLAEGGGMTDIGKMIERQTYMNMFPDQDVPINLLQDEIDLLKAGNNPRSKEFMIESFRSKQAAVNYDQDLFAQILKQDFQLQGTDIVQRGLHRLQPEQLYAEFNQKKAAPPIDPIVGELTSLNTKMSNLLIVLGNKSGASMIEIMEKIQNLIGSEDDESQASYGNFIKNNNAQQVQYNPNLLSQGIQSFKTYFK